MALHRLTKGCIFEVLGTFALVFFGAGSIVLTTTHSSSGADLLTVALAHGFVLVVFVTGALHVSGGQFNPAVSLGVWAVGKQSAGQMGAFVLSQLVGAGAGAAALMGLLGAETANSEGAALGATIGSLTRAGDVAAVFGLELVMTFALMWAVLTCLVDARAHKLGGFAVGLTVAFCVLTAGPLTGASLNPARTFGPALFGHWEMHWVYWAAPAAGAGLAAALWRLVSAPEPADAPGA